MLKSVFIPNKYNAFAWVNVLGLIALVVLGQIEAYTILLGYFLETIIIGLFNCVKMYQCYKHNDKEAKIGFNLVFFCFHYGFFIAVQSIFLFLIFSFSDALDIKEPFHLFSNFKMALQLNGMFEVLGLLTFTQVLKYIVDFLMPKKFLQFKVKEIFFKPYLRIFIQQLVVILGAFFAIFSGAPVIAAVILIVTRFILDAFLVAIKADSELLELIVDKMHNGKTTKEELRQQLLMFSE